MADNPEWRASGRKRAEVAAIATLGYPVLRTLGSTWKWRVSGAEHVEAIKARGLYPIHSFWHGRILPATVYFQRRGIVAQRNRAIFHIVSSLQRRNLQLIVAAVDPVHVHLLLRVPDRRRLADV